MFKNVRILRVVVDGNTIPLIKMIREANTVVSEGLTYYRYHYPLKEAKNAFDMLKAGFPVIMQIDPAIIPRMIQMGFVIAGEGKTFTYDLELTKKLVNIIGRTGGL